MKNIVKAAYTLNSTDPEILLSRCNEALENNKSLVIFPEGSRSVPGKKSKVSRGFAHIALNSKCDILPVKINCVPRTLMKNQPWYVIPEQKPHFSLEALPVISIDSYTNPRRLTDDIKKILEIE